MINATDKANLLGKTAESMKANGQTENKMDKERTPLNKVKSEKGSGVMAKESIGLTEEFTLNII